MPGRLKYVRFLTCALLRFCAAWQSIKNRVMYGGNNIKIYDGNIGYESNVNLVDIC